jgi:hypothetical protein
VRELEKVRPEAFSTFSIDEAEKRAALVHSPLAERPMFRHSIEKFDEDELRVQRLAEFCRREGQEFDLQPLTFWEWDAKYNPELFQP